MLLATVTSFTTKGRLVETIAYTYGDAGDVIVPTSVKTLSGTFTLTNWRVVDTTAPFLSSLAH